jgi:hypothetical protein
MSFNPKQSERIVVALEKIAMEIRAWRIAWERTVTYLRDEKDEE